MNEGMARAQRMGDRLLEAAKRQGVTGMVALHFAHDHGCAARSLGPGEQIERCTCWPEVELLRVYTSGRTEPIPSSSLGVTDGRHKTQS